MNLIRKHWPLVCSVLLMLLGTAAVVAFSLQRTRGHLVYCLDDTYIHMAIAKHLAKDGVWGVTPYSFSSSSSSLLWTLLLSGCYLLKVSETAPLILNVAFAIIALTAAYWLFRQAGLSDAWTFGGLLILTFTVPLPMMVMLGMEHILHACVTLAFAGLAARELSSEKGRHAYMLALLAPVVSTARYEGLFTVFVVCLLFLIRRRWKQALVIGCLAIFPVVSYGLISKSHGWYFLPNSVQLKGVHPELSAGFFLRLMKRVTNFPAISMLALVTTVCYFLRYGRRWQWNTISALYAIFIGNFILHAVFGRFGWFYRYEAYLLALGTAAVWHLVFAQKQPQMAGAKRLVSLVMLLILALPIMQRSLEAFTRAPQASANTFDQQYQMGLFARRFYQGRTIALNDIGAVNFLADVRCLDFQGLASMETAGRMAADYILDPRELQAAIDSARPDVGIIFQSVYGPMLPPTWTTAGEWTTPGYIMGGNDTVSFYATKAEDKRELADNLSKFRDMLPSEVIQSGEYTE